MEGGRGEEGEWRRVSCVGVYLDGVADSRPGAPVLVEGEEGIG